MLLINSSQQSSCSINAINFVFLMSVFYLLNYETAFAEPINGAFGLKLGEKVSAEEYKKASKISFTIKIRKSSLRGIFSGSEGRYKILPLSKSIYEIQSAIPFRSQRNGGCDTYLKQTITKALRQKYKEHEVEYQLSSTYEKQKKFVKGDVSKFQKNIVKFVDGDRVIRLNCYKILGIYELILTYEDERLAKSYYDERRDYLDRSLVNDL